MNNQTDKKTKLFKLRQEAEMLLNKNEVRLKKSLSDYDKTRLIHELEVHKIELEMQNEELRRAKEFAELAEKKYSELYDFAPSGYLTLSREGEILNLNRNAESMLGKNREKLIKGSFGFFVSQDARAVYNNFLRKIFETRLKQTCELKLVEDNDSVIHILVNGIISNIDEKCLVTLVDITRHKHAENELKIAKEKAEENERLKSSFLANMSHEIRTPMNGILGFTELLKAMDLKSEDQQNYISIIEKSGVRMLNILNDIISISKIESGQAEVTLTDTNVNEQVEDIYYFFKLEAEHKNLHFSFKNALPVNEAYIRTDREKLYAVLTNLVKNAIKFTEKGSIEIGYTQKGEFIEFYIKDTGPGIPDGQKGVIFERFRQIGEPTKQKYEGAGLGLSISKVYVEMLGGKIRVENNTGKRGIASGAKFLFTVPALPAKELNRVTPIGTTDNSTKGKTRKLKILIAEDDEFSELLFIKMVEGLTRSILKTKTGIEAIKACRENPDIDLVMMDINMPEMDGYEATRKIREFNKDVVIIAQTAYALPGDKEKAIAAGCNDCITKPISRARLISLITTAHGLSTKGVNDVKISKSCTTV